MDIDRLIHELNQKDKVGELRSDLTEKFELSESQKKLLTIFRPEQSLVVYGTLAPGRPNHHVIQHIKGRWVQAYVQGKLVSDGWGATMGYNAFHPDGSDRIQSFILQSDKLVEHQKFLDEFEGDGYRRILVKYETVEHTIGVGFIYAIKPN